MVSAEPLALPCLAEEAAMKSIRTTVAGVTLAIAVPAMLAACGSQPAPDTGTDPGARLHVAGPVRPGRVVPGRLPVALAERRG